MFFIWRISLIGCREGGNGAEMYRKCGILMTMNDIDHGAFRALFGEACFKCFGHVVNEPLTETESKLLYNKVFEETGLVIGWKSIKNYSFFLFSVSSGKQENPSVATLDTLSRYVLDKIGRASCRERVFALV